MVYSVNYRVGDKVGAFETAEVEDIADLLWDVEQRLRTSHPELGRRPYLTQDLADRLLTVLVDDPRDIDLGDLG